MTEKKMISWEKLEKIDPRYLFLILIALLIVPLLNPIGLPISINNTTRSAYDLIEGLPSGSNAFIFIETAVSGWPELLPGLIAVTQHSVQKGLKIVFAPGGSAVDYSLTMERVFASVDFSKYQYGVDYVYFGYFPGYETGVATLAQNFRSVYQTDYQGKSIDSLPLMKNINSAKDFKVATVFASSEGGYWLIKHWGVGQGVPVIVATVAVGASGVIPFYGHGMTGMILGTRGAAEYELLLKTPSTAVKRLDGLNIAHLLFMVTVVVGNIGYFASRGKRR